MPHHYLQLPFAPADLGISSAEAVAVLSPQGLKAEIDIASGRVSTLDAGERFESATSGARSVSNALGSLEETARFERGAAVTTVSDRTGAATSFPGKLVRAWASGRNVVARVGSDYEDTACVAFVVGRPALRLPAPLAGWIYPCDNLQPSHVFLPRADPGVQFAEGWVDEAATAIGGDVDLAACAFGGALYLFRFEAGEVRALASRLPDEGGYLARVEVRESRVLVTSGKKLFVVETSELDFASPLASVTLTFEPRVAPREDKGELAVVAYVFRDNIGVDHPKMGRLRVMSPPDGPPLAKGDQVVIDDARERLPGIFDVHAWHKLGEKRTEPPPLPPWTLEGFAARPLEARAPPDGDAPDVLPSDALRALAARHGFVAPPFLLTLLARWESDPVFQRSLAETNLERIEDVRIESISASWPNADPNLIAVYGFGNGDSAALYVYPPYCGSTHEPIAVEYLHESNSAEFRGTTFAAHFDHQLTRAAKEAKKEGDSDALEAIARVRAQLDLPAGSAPKGKAPAWLPKEDGSVAKDARDDERRLLALFLQYDEEAKEGLRAIYQERGWSLALANLEASGDD